MFPLYEQSLVGTITIIPKGEHPNLRISMACTVLEK